MESFFTRYRNLIVLLAILVVQIVGLPCRCGAPTRDAGRIDPGDGPGVRLIRLWAEAVVAPPERGIQGAKMAAIHLWQNYVDLRHVREQNQDLQKTIDRLRLEQASLLEDARQGERLQALLDFQHRYIYTHRSCAGHWLKRQRSVTCVLSRQGIEQRTEAGYGGDYRRWHCRQGARCVSQHGAGAGGQRPDQRRGGDS